MPRYTYQEPEFDTTIDETFISPTSLRGNGPVYLSKEDNVVSEQTFRIVVQVSDSVPPGEGINPAVINDDYEIGVRGTTSLVMLFPPNMQRVLFRFTLRRNTSPDGTKAFLARSAAEDTADFGGVVFNLPDYLPPIRLAAETYIFIEDNDRKVLR